MNKICEIINGRFSWILKVDGEIINFDGGHNADYFEKHYFNLGYIVKRNDDYWKLKIGDDVQYENKD